MEDPLMYKGAEELKVIQRLEKIRQLNTRNEWRNSGLYKLLCKPNLYIMAYERIKSGPRNLTPGSDDKTLDSFDMDEINKIVQEMKAESYRCKPVRRTFIPKANGKLRKLGIPCMRDKVVQEAVRILLEAVYDSPHGPSFSDSSHGFRRNRSCHTALEQVQKWNGVVWIIEGDIQNYFDDVDHEILVNILRERIEDERFLNLIRKILKAGCIDLNEVRKDSLAGTPQGGIVSSILANIYLDKLDKFVEKLKGEMEKGKDRRWNPEYKRLQDRKLLLAKKGQTRSEEFQKLNVKLKTLPSMDMKDPNFVRVRYVRYADDWMIGVIGSHKLAEEVKQKVGEFLSTQLKLTLSKNKTTITSAKREEAKFLGFKVRVGRSIKSQKQKITTSKSGKAVKKRTTGMEVIIKAPMKELIKKLQLKGFCDGKGIPIHRPSWMLMDEDQIVLMYSSINRGILEYYRMVDNWARVQRIQYILKFSLAKTLAGKRKDKISNVIRDKEIQIKTVRDGKERIHRFYQNHDWTNKRKVFSKGQRVDLVRMNIKLRTGSKLGLSCICCGDTEKIEMHHVRHLRKMTQEQASGFTRVMIAMNRKQVPVCKRCHKLIHSGKYDGLSLHDLAYDMGGATKTVLPKLKAKYSEGIQPEPVLQST